MKTFFFLVLAALVGYATGTAVGYFLIMTFSSNVHDRMVEAATTGALIFGPLTAIAAMIGTWAWRRQSSGNR